MQKYLGLFLNRAELAEGEVLLFRSRKSRHRAVSIPVMGLGLATRKDHFAIGHSKFDDMMPFKDWFRRMCAQNKGIS